MKSCPQRWIELIFTRIKKLKVNGCPSVGLSLVKIFEISSTLNQVQSLVNIIEKGKCQFVPNVGFDIQIMGDTSVDAKTVLDSVKSSTWKFLKFQMSGGEVDSISTMFVK